MSSMGFESRPLTRRRLLQAGTGALAVAGFDLLGGRWVTAAQASGCTGFAGAPALDGTLQLDDASRANDQTDRGNMVFHTPAAVLRPGSVADIQAMVRFCRDCGIRVATRGQHHTTFGQGLTYGLIIEISTLNTIHSVGPAGADVDAGVLWRDVIKAALAQGLRRPGLTGYTGISVGGVLSVGGCPLSNVEGAVIDRVQQLSVVTGTGELVVCSESVNSDLFNAMLGGLGQCGIIVRALLELVPAKPLARTYLLHYEDFKTFFADFQTLVQRAECNDVYNVCVPPGSNTFVYEINATVFYDPLSPPDDLHLMRGLSIPALLIPHTDQPYYDYTQFVDTQVSVLQLAGWDQLVKPWFDVWLPQTAVQTYVPQIVNSLTPADVGTGGFVLLFAQQRSKLTRPFFRMPDPSLGEWVYLFDVLTTSSLPGPDAAFAQQMLTRNGAWYAQARQTGATRYPIGSIAFTGAQWADHYGELWTLFNQLKHRYDPNGILTPGPGIFQ
jgi:FAD/FMN-containing dehydrogenase